MNLTKIIHEIAAAADSLFRGMSSSSEIRSTLSDLLLRKYPTLTATDRQTVQDKVLSILKDEGFFDARGSGDAWDSDSSDDTDEE
jgi:hypothetical protein